MCKQKKIKPPPKNRIILDLCGGSGAWTKPYAEANYDVRLITLPKDNVITYIPPKNVYGILAAPPCTEFSLARNGHPHIKSDFVQGMAAVNACMRIIFQCLEALNFWALENPVGKLSRFLGKPKYVFHPWFFGDSYTKKTALWGKFVKPKKLFAKKEDVMSEEQIKRCKANTRKLKSSNLAYERAITPSGFAEAFLKANP